MHINYWLFQNKRHLTCKGLFQLGSYKHCNQSNGVHINLIESHWNGALLDAHAHFPLESFKLDWKFEINSWYECWKRIRTYDPIIEDAKCHSLMVKKLIQNLHCLTWGTMTTLIALMIHKVPPKTHNSTYGHWTQKSYKLIAHTDLHLIDAWSIELWGHYNTTRWIKCNEKLLLV